MIVEKKIKTRLIETGTKKEDPQHEIIVKIDFSEESERQILEWAAKDRVIVFQNTAARKMKLEDYKGMNGKTFKVSQLCKSVKTTIVKRMSPGEMASYIKSLPKNERLEYIKMLSE